MQQDQSDRRQYARQAVMLPCRVDGVTTTGTTHVIDVSAGGCFIASRAFAATGAEITVHANFGGAELALTGRIVHERPGRGFAIEFGNLSSDTRYLLEQFLMRAPARSY
jgi:hypothetical protein